MSIGTALKVKCPIERPTPLPVHSTGGPTRPHGRRAALAVVSALIVMLTSLTSLLAGAGPAAGATPAAPAICKGHKVVSTSIVGHTRNRTGLVLTRTYLEKGVLNTWGDEPALVIGAHATDEWCAFANVFGTAMKVVYAFGNNSQVTFEAWSYREGPIGSRCSVDGPDATAYRCLERVIDTHPRLVTVFFTLEPIR